MRYGEANPNYRGTAIKVCTYCGKQYSSYNKGRKYCSVACSAGSKPRMPKRQLVLKLVARRPEPFIRKQNETVCRQCNKLFTSSPSRKRMYCSYQCHLDSGGAFRAGIASSGARMKYGPKKDANHNEIFDEMRKHCAVYDLSSMGRGVPDGIAWVDGQWKLFDVKNPKTGYGRRGLNMVQQKWIGQWKGGPVYLIYTIEEARRFATGQLTGLKVCDSDGYASAKSVDEALKAVGVR